MKFVTLARRIGQERRRAPGSGMVVNTYRALEGEFLDTLAGIPSSNRPKLFTVGPAELATGLRGNKQRFSGCCVTWTALT